MHCNHAINDLTNTLALQWPIDVTVSRNEFLSTIVSDPDGKRHYLTVSEQMATDPMSLLPFLAQTLCRGALAERYDALFSAILVEPNESSPGVAILETDQTLHEMMHACEVASVWCDDIRHHHWSELTERYIHTVAHGRPKPRRHSSTFQEYFHPISAIALSKRHSLPLPHIAPLETCDTEEDCATVERFATAYANLPRLTDDRDTNLDLFEQCARQFAQMLNFSFTPHLIKHRPHSFWKIKHHTLHAT